MEFIPSIEMKCPKSGIFLVIHSFKKAILLNANSQFLVHKNNL